MNQLETITHRAYRGYICERLENGKWKVEDHLGKPVNTFRECKDIIRKERELLSRYEKQLVLYTKSWFKETDMIEDIKSIMSAAYDCDPLHYSTNDVLRYVEKLYFKLIECGLIEYGKDKIFSELFHRMIVWKDKKSADMNDVIEFMYGQISTITVDGKIELGEPDYTLLPKKDKREKVEA